LGARERKKRQEISKANAPKITFDDGLQVLTDTLADNIKDSIKYNCEVSEIVKDNNGYKVVLKNSSFDMETFSGVLITSTAYKISEMKLSDGNERLDLSELKNIEYPPVASVVLGYKREDVKHPVNGFGVLIPRKEGFRILGAILVLLFFHAERRRGM
jgi:oxygen-dependent protoporphyrinogen oxidase